MGKFEGKIATNWPSEREKIKKGRKIDIEWLCPHAFNLRNSDFSLPRYNTVTYGKHSIGFLGPSLWAKLTNKERNIETLSSFKNMIRKKDISAVVEGCGRDCYLCLS